MARGTDLNHFGAYSPGVPAHRVLSREGGGRIPVRRTNPAYKRAKGYGLWSV